MSLSDLFGASSNQALGSMGLGQGIGQVAQRSQEDQNRLAQQQGQWQVTPQAMREALRGQRNQQSGLLNSQGQFQQGLGNALNQWWDERPPLCNHEIVDGSCKHCSESATKLVAKALRRKKHE